MDSTGNASKAYGGWYQNNLFGTYSFYFTDTRGNHVYWRKVSGTSGTGGTSYYIRKNHGNWIVGLQS